MILVNLKKRAKMRTAELSTLNVTELDPRIKHPTIFQWFDKLAPGEAFILHNDHDPKPLYYQMLNERGNVFHWEYLEEGPVWWKVRIARRNTEELGEKLVGEIAASDLRKAEVFRKYGIDFCCGGRQTLKEACAEKGLEVSTIEQELGQSTTSRGQRPLEFNEWRQDFLVEYIVNMHHGYVRKTLPELLALASKVARVHGASHPELLRIQELAELVGRELTSHMDKEESILFPYIQSLVQAEDSGKGAGTAQFGSIRNPIRMMEHEHDEAGRIMAEIRSLSNEYLVPDDACTSYTMLYRMLEEFEHDLHIHVHLENNILFPKAMKMESEMVKQEN